ncbi:polyisoprenoid-binding protein [Flavobacteriaceae bacterium Ap0902]|nr:polyisoprenoid-binding protein [Flavobacteriaceae bacterium Ap0902]
MKKFSSFLLFILVAGLINAQTVWENDPYHTRMEFRVTHWLVNTVSGNFNRAEFVVDKNREDFTKSSLTFSADVASINTNVDIRDEDLRSPNFFDAKKYPKLTFKSSKIVEVAKRVYDVSGDLTMHGVTKPVTVRLYDRGLSKNNDDNTIQGYHVRATLNRFDYGIGTENPISEISEKVEITGDFEMLKR